MKYFILEPEVAGGIGRKSKILYENSKIKKVTFLDYEFESWLGDDILTTHPCFIISESLYDIIKVSDLKGFHLQKIGISFSNFFLEVYNKKILPNFIRLLPFPINEVCLINEMLLDFYLYKNTTLIISEKALDILKKFNLSNANILNINTLEKYDDVTGIY